MLFGIPHLPGGRTPWFVTIADKFDYLPACCSETLSQNFRGYRQRDPLRIPNRLAGVLEAGFQLAVQRVQSVIPPFLINVTPNFARLKICDCLASVF